MNPKRELAEKEILQIISDIDIHGDNAKIWKNHLSKMNDKEFDTLMHNFYDNPAKYHIDIVLDQSGNKDDILDLDHLEKVAKKHKIKLREYVAFPHCNPDDPDNPFITATEVPILVMYVRKMQQMLEKKNFSAGNIDVCNPITGQVTGDSKAASLGDMQTAALVTNNQQDVIREFLTIRSDNMEGKLKMLDKIQSDGEVNYKDLNVNLDQCQSIQTLKVFMTAAMLKTDGITQKAKPSNE